MKVYDFHAHPVTNEFIKAMDDLGINVIEDDGFPLPKWSIDSHLDFMKEAGIDHTILSIPTPHIHNGDDNLAAIAARKKIQKYLIYALIILSIFLLWQDFLCHVLINQLKN